MNGAFYDKAKGLEVNVKELFAAVSELIRLMNQKEASATQKVIYADGGATGTVAVPREATKYTLFLACVGAEPIVCARYNDAISGQGIEENFFATVVSSSSGVKLIYESSNDLKSLIAIM